MVNSVSNSSSTDTATVQAGITLNDSTSVMVIAANPSRRGLHVNCNFPDKASWVKLQAASVDNDKKGIFLNEKEKGVTHWDMPSDRIYTGEISAIADSGTPVIYVTEY